LYPVGVAADRDEGVIGTRPENGVMHPEIIPSAIGDGNQSAAVPGRHRTLRESDRMSSQVRLHPGPNTGAAAPGAGSAWTTLRTPATGDVSRDRRG
jgi:hypothetical protein